MTMKKTRIRLTLDLFVPDEQTMQARDSLDALVRHGLDRGALGLLDIESHTHRIEFEPADTIDVLLDTCRDRWGRAVELRYDDQEGAWRVENQNGNAVHIVASDTTIAGLRQQLVEFLGTAQAR